MASSWAERVPLRSSDDVARARQVVRRVAVELGFGLVDQTRLVTATSELARNAVVHGGGGELRVEPLQGAGREGLALEFSDEGPGIADHDRALTDGWTSGGGLGLGLGGARRLVDEFELRSAPGEGTTVRVVRWR